MSFVFSFPILFVFVILLTILLYWVYYEHGAGDYYIFQIRMVPIALLLLGIISLFVINNYINPPTRIFTNADHTVLAHEGFMARDYFSLSEENNREEALWGSSDGVLRLQSQKDHVVLLSQSYYEPVFYANQEKPGVLYLLNPVYKESIDSEIIFYNQNERAIGISIQQDINNPNKTTYTIHSYLTGRTDTSDFARTIYRGYPVLSILLESKLADEIAPELRYALEGCFFVRDQILIQERVIGVNDDFYFLYENNHTSDSKLLFFPSRSFISNPIVDVNLEYDHNYFSRVFETNLAKNDFFFKGIGYSQSDVFILSDIKDDKFQIKFMLPKMFRLPDKKRNHTVFITSSEEHIKNNDLRSGYLLSEINNPESKLHFYAEVSFTAGKSSNLLSFLVKDHAISVTEPTPYYADDPILLKTLSNDDSVAWLISFVDFKYDNPIGARLFYLYILFFILLIVSLVFMRSRLRIQGVGSFLHPLEITVYLTVYLMVLLRLFLIWRVSTFPPIDHISAGEFYTLQNSYKYAVNFTLYPLIVFISILALFSLWRESFYDFLNSYLSRIRMFLLSNYQVLIICLGVIFLHFSILLILFNTSASANMFRFLIIFLPVVLFFLFDFLVRELFHVLNFNDRDRFFRFFRIVALALVWGLTISFLLLKDTGYGIIFSSFLSFYIVLNYFFHRLQLLVVFLLLWLIFFWIHDLVILWAILNIHIVIYFGIASLLLGLMYYFLRTGSYLRHLTRLQRLFLGAIIVSVLFVALIAFIKPVEVRQKVEEKMTHGKYRVEALRNLTSDLLLRYSFDSRENIFILRASQNQYFINYFSNLPKGRYFNIQQHYHQGSTFITQTTDLAVLRYVVAEHYNILVLLILLLFLTPMFALSFFDAEGELRDRIYINGPLGLIIVTSLLILFAATNRFAFFGQDFPFLSTTSLLSLILPLTLYSIVMIQVRDSDRTTDYLHNYYAYLLIGFVIGSFLFAPSSLYKDKGEDDRYELNELMVEVEKKINLINSDFLLFQASNITKLKQKPFRDILELYKAHASEGVNMLLKDTSETNTFFYSIWEHFNEPANNQWNPRNIIHVRKLNDYYHIAVNKSFYSLLPPHTTEATWRGNLVAADMPGRLRFFNHKTREVDFTLDGSKDTFDNILMIVDSDDIVKYRNNLLNLEIVEIPGRYTPTSAPILLLSSKKGSYDATQAEFKILTRNEEFDQSNTGGHVVNLQDNDQVILSIKRDNKLYEIVHWQLLQENSYLSQSIEINGRQRFFYPLGDRFIWAYNFTQLINDTYRGNIDFANENVYVALDYQLMNRFYELSQAEMRSIGQLNEREKDMFRRFLLGDRSKLMTTRDGILVNPSFRLEFSSEFMRTIDSINQQYVNNFASFDPVEKDIYLRNLVKELAFYDGYSFSAVVIDGDGRIRSIFDNKDTYRVNPNNINDFNQFLESLYRYSSGALERDFFANECLIGLLPGPASSFKPIFYAAINSQINLDWSNFDVIPPSNNLLTRLTVPSETGNILQYFASHDISDARWNIDRRMFLNNNMNITPRTYLANSNNLYHSVIVFLGSYSWSQLSGMQHGNNEEMFPLSIIENHGSSISKFPLINKNGTQFKINPNAWPEFNNEYSLTASGLTNNFHLYTHSNRFSSWHKPVNLYGDHFDLFHSNTLSNYSLWVFPEENRFLSIDRGVEPKIRTGFVQPVLGGFPIFVSPLKMGEAAFRLITLNSSQNVITLNNQNARTSETYTFFNYDTRTYNSKSSFFKQYQENVFSPMRGVAQTGTARSLGPFVRKHEENGYYFYFKTGTISQIGDRDKRNKNLMVIITNQEIESAEFSYSDLIDLRFYVLFLTYHGINKDIFNNRMFEKYIDAVINSNLFSEYMNN